MVKPLFVLVGPSGSGKSRLMEDLCDLLGLTAIESYTNRPKRSDDETGHNFVSTEELEKLTLLNSAVFGGYTYGMTAEQIAGGDICIMEPSGAQGICAQLEPDRCVVLIGVQSSPEDIRARLLSNGVSEDAVEARMNRDARVFDGLKRFCDRVFNNPNGGYTSVLMSMAQYIERLQPLGACGMSSIPNELTFAFNTVEADVF